MGGPRIQESRRGGEPRRDRVKPRAGAGAAKLGALYGWYWFFSEPQDTAPLGVPAAVVEASRFPVPGALSSMGSPGTSASQCRRSWAASFLSSARAVAGCAVSPEPSLAIAT